MDQEESPTQNRPPWWRRSWAVGLVAGVFALAGMLLAIRLMDDTALPKTQLTTLAGKTTDLGTLAAGKPLVVNLWATWCPPCRLELPYLAAAQRQDPGINFAFVDQGEDALTVERYLKSANLSLANVMLDAGMRLARELGSSGLPITLFYDAGGRMVDSHVGALTPALLEKKLTPLRAAAGRAAKQ